MDASPKPDARADQGPTPDLATLIQEGFRLQQEGTLDEAGAHYRQVLDRDPGHFAALFLLGALRAGQGEHEAAAGLLERALDANPGSATAHAALGRALWHLGRPDDALSHLGRAAMLKPDFLDALLDRGILLRALGRPAEALASLDRALALQPGHPGTLLNRAAVLNALDRPLDSMACCDRILETRPDDPDALAGRGHALMELERQPEALASYERALDLRPDHADTLLARGNALLQLRRMPEALACYEQALAVQPEYPEALLNRGNALIGLGRPQAALASYERALELQPGFADALANRAAALLALRRPLDALASAGQALALQPGHGAGVINRGMALLDLKRPSEALACFDEALAARPGHLDAWLNRGTALHLLGRNEEALACYDRALALQPDHAGAHSNKIFVRDFLPELGFVEHQSERRAFGLAQGILPDPRPHGNDRDPERMLVLGYVSADFKHHSAASCFGPVLRHHDRSAFRVICYSGVQAEDEWTRDFRQLADVWRPVQGLTDAELAEQIRADGVDILIDLSGHSKGNRLPVFARRPAPVQVTAWGHGGGTGLAAVDYQLTDPVYIPQGVRPLFAEACWDLPCCITFEPPEAAPEVQALPARANGFVTFGCLSRFSKVTRAALELWFQILDGVPGSRLLMKDPVLGDAQTRRQILDAAAAHGLAPDRIELRGGTSHREHLATYGEVDLVLDTFPHNGGIATWEALWMGAPVLALLGGSPGSRISGAILHALGLEGWVVETEADYLALALRQAADLDALERSRASIRAVITASPAGNPVLYTRAVEAAYREMWRRRALGGLP